MKEFLCFHLLIFFFFPFFITFSSPTNTGHLAWWQKWDRTTLYILIGSLILLLAVVIIVCLIIICICRNRRKRDKCKYKLSHLLTIFSLYSKIVSNEISFLHYSYCLRQFSLLFSCHVFVILTFFSLSPLTIRRVLYFALHFVYEQSNTKKNKIKSFLWMAFIWQ